MSTTPVVMAAPVESTPATADDLTWQSIVEKHASRVYRLA